MSTAAKIGLALIVLAFGLWLGFQLAMWVAPK
jgi:hypothetical protein